MPARDAVRALLLRLAYTNLLLALTAAGWAVFVLVLLGAPVTLGAVLPPFATIFAVYTFDKVVLLDPADTHNDPARTALLTRWRLPLIGLAAVLALAGAVLTAQRSLECLFLYLVPLAVGAAYGAPILPPNYRYRRLKDITFVKNLVVALSWGLAVGVLPVRFAGIDVSHEVAVAGLYVGLRMLVNTVFFDIGDVRGDLAAGTRTVPVVFGVRATRLGLHAVSAFSAAMLAGLTLAFGLHGAGLHVALLALLYGYTYLRAAVDEDSDLGFACDVVADGEGVVTLLLVLAVLA